MKMPRIAAPLCAALLAALCPPAAQAKAPLDGWVEGTLRAVSSSRTVAESDTVDSSGTGAVLETGFEWRSGRTAVQFDLRGEVFDYAEDGRTTRESASATLAVTHQVSDALAVTVEASHAEDIVTLESRETDQDAVRVAAKLTRGADQFGAAAQYRRRDYNGDSADSADGMRYSASYQHRFGSYHWLRLDAAQESLSARTASRGYDRTTVRATYSLPLARHLRLRPQLEYRSWRYDARFVGGDPAAARRRDHYLEPELALAYGRSDRGLQLMARAAYQLRGSNDPAYRDDQPVFEAAVGYRF